ncbi:hypothetical protein AB0C12_32575 [Actinoplanes sp. NPDC048967]|uniref:hypothetical protein n=1 Tax=Actinoplanes sp. NPDC048967 TaxID=3155269 RepID=UPI0033D65A22
MAMIKAVLPGMRARRAGANDTVHGTQPGDPAKAAQAIITAVAAPEPPALLLLGADALHAFSNVLDAQRAELERWRDLTVSTGFDG